MNGTSSPRTGWGARLLIGLVLVLAGAAAATWGLAHYQRAASVLGVVQPAPAPATRPVALTSQPAAPSPQAAPAPSAAEAARIAGLENRLARVENAAQRAEGSAGRADALVVAFAARRAIDRGIALGYLENLLVGRFGRDHQQAVATIITASHQPVRLDDLATEYDGLGDQLRRGGPKKAGGPACGVSWANWCRSTARPSVTLGRRPLRPRPAAPCRRSGRPGAGRNHAPARRRSGERLGGQGPPLCRGPPRARRDRVRGAARRTKPACLTTVNSGVGKRLPECESCPAPHREGSAAPCQVLANGREFRGAKKS